MMRISKLFVIAVLTGTLGVVGCSDDTGEPGGSGGGGGTGGTDAPPLCGEGQSLGADFETGPGLVNCKAIDTIDVPIEVTLAAKPMGSVAVGEETDFEVQVLFVLTEETVGNLGAFSMSSEISESSAEVDDGEGGTSVNVPAVTPCVVDLTADPDNNGMPGPIEVATPVVMQGWTEANGEIVLRAADMTFAISQPVRLTLSTKGEEPECVWATVPTVTFEAGAGGTGGTGGVGGTGGAGGTGGVGGG